MMFLEVEPAREAAIAKRSQSHIDLQYCRLEAGYALEPKRVRL